ncbi:MAG: hypothetical protein NUV50_06785 [Rhodospirillales bacterium]|nr:hypothetical protein [Rhodospirillales bacterium]
MSGDTITILLLSIFTILALKIIINKAFERFGRSAEKTDTSNDSAQTHKFRIPFPQHKILRAALIGFISFILNYIILFGFTPGTSMASTWAQHLLNTFTTFLSFIDGQPLTKALFLGIFSVILLIGFYIAVVIFIIKPLVRVYENSHPFLPNNEKWMYGGAASIGMVTSAFMPI